MKIYSEHTPKEYLRALKNRRGSFLAFGGQRFTGFVIGRFFSITHHAGFEWNRRYTNERNSAVGFVQKTEYGSCVRYIPLKGSTTPQALLFSYLIFLATGFLYPNLEFRIIASVSLGMTALMALSSAIVDSLTENGQRGEMEIFGLMYDPANPLAYLEIMDK